MSYEDDQDLIVDQAREIHALEEAKNTAYGERNQVVAALSALFPSSLERHPEDDSDWEDDWRWIVYVETPAGQLSWHLHDSELRLFSHLDRETGVQWDGHNDAEKYRRLRILRGEK